MNSSTHSSPKTKPKNSPSRFCNTAFLALLLFLIYAAKSACANEGNIYYLMPQDQYKEWFDRGVGMDRGKGGEGMDLKHTSNDGKRWYAVTYSMTDLGPNYGQRLDYHIHTYANKNYVTTLTLFDVSPEGVPEVRWLNDKLVYVEFWWRSTVGGYLIFDPDNEYIVTREMMFRGTPPEMAQHPRFRPGGGYHQ
jgi:hypothetical protein